MANTASLYSVMTCGRGITNKGKFLSRMTGVPGEFLQCVEFTVLMKMIFPVA
ncbi:MAG: hypothetical protein K8S15_09005 [Candidatus Aegiribacteria sp.]|nr:hypothetical protein [Candidatus Aegiribacteria sp.]